jgi:hypothetical protein
LNTSLPPELSIAHRLPHRTRLRWNGSGDPSPELLSQLASLPDVREIEYRGASRSVILHHSHRLSPAARDGRDVPPPRARKSAGSPRPKARWLQADRERSVRVLEDLLTLGLVGAWVLDLTMGGAGGAAIPVLVALLMGLAVYRIWQRRGPGSRSRGDDLIILRAV